MPGGEKWANVWHFGGSAADPFEPVRDKVRAFYDALKSRQSTAWRIERMVFGQVPALGAGTALIDQQEFEINISGTNAAAALPNQTCLVVSLRTTRSGRRGRGRIYLGPFTEADNDQAVPAASMPAAACSSAVAAQMGILLNAPPTANQLVVYSRSDGTEASVLGGYVDRRWDTQRRRAESLSTQERAIFPAGS